jgi:hypothetical protein
MGWARSTRCVVAWLSIQEVATRRSTRFSTAFQGLAITRPGAICAANGRHDSREFLVGLGFKVDERQQRNFTAALEGATLRAKLLGDAIEKMAGVVVEKVGEVSSQFEQLYYQSQRVLSSVPAIRAFEFAFSQLGGTIQIPLSALLRHSGAG